MIDETSTAMVKRGEECVRVSLRRSINGLRVTVKAHPSIEALLRAWGEDSAPSSINTGRHWTSATLLKVYQLYQATGRLGDGKELYRLDAAGMPLLIEDDYGESVNISFLRLVGVSEGAGITFELRGVFTLTIMENLQKKIMRACKRFYQDYLLPIDLTCVVSTQEVRL